MFARTVLAALALTLAACQSMSPPATAPAAAAAPPPAWQQGRTADQATSTLAPHAGRNTATPTAEIPLSTFKLPPGFKAEIWATGIPGARAMARGESGKIYIGTRGIGRVYEITDTGTQRVSRVVVDKLVQPAGVAVKDGSLYVIAIDKALRYDGIEKNPAVAPVDMTAVFSLPKEQHHNWKYIAFGPDNKLYVPFGAPCNICEPTAEYAQIRRYNADGSGMEVIARGVRNTQGFAWHPVTKEMWFTDHGRDWAGDDGPQDELNRLAKPGNNYGFPYCHANGIADPEIKKEDACKGVTRPAALMGSHAAVMGVKFYTGKMFPAEYQNTMFLVRKGSWNRTKPNGFDVVNVRVAQDGKATYKPFATGFQQGAENYNFWGRPAYVQQMPDGAMLLSDEQTGAIYRISYERPKGAAKKQ